jgi:hypothetical protein
MVVSNWNGVFEIRIIQIPDWTVLAKEYRFKYVNWLNLPA